MLKPVRQTIRALTGKTLGRTHQSLQRILGDWDRIVGPEFAARCTPVRIHYQKPNDKSAKPRAVLEVATTSALSTTLHYQTGVMIERLAALFGDRWIESIKIVHNANLFRPPRGAARSMAPLSAQETQGLETALQAVRDDALQEKLKRFGKSLLLSDKNR